MQERCIKGLNYLFWMSLLALDSTVALSILDYFYSLDITVIFVSHRSGELDRCTQLIAL